MSKLVFSNIFRFIALLLLQILLLNYVYMGGYIVPVLYILAVLMLPTSLGKVPMLLIAFASGVIVDVFCNIPGFHAFSCTLMAFARILFGNKLIMRDDPADIDEPSIQTVPFQQFSIYVLLMALIYCLAFCLIEAFSFGNFWMTMLAMVLDTLVAWVLIMLCQLLVSPKKQ